MLGTPAVRRLYAVLDHLSGEIAELVTTYDDAEGLVCEVWFDEPARAAPLEILELCFDGSSWCVSPTSPGSQN